MLLVAGVLAWPSPASAGRVAVSANNCPLVQAPATAPLYATGEVAYGPCSVLVNGTVVRVDRSCSLTSVSGSHQRIYEHECRTVAGADAANVTQECRNYYADYDYAPTAGSQDDRCNSVISVGPRTVSSGCWDYYTVPAWGVVRYYRGCSAGGAGVEAGRACGYESNYVTGDDTELCVLAVRHRPTGTECLVASEEHHPYGGGGTPIPVVEDPFDLELTTVACPAA